ncbi:ion channel [Streptomyces sp. NPDC051994]|uniref:ion channel n=1 Tax=unclassified Streptomyces TaxID=2593676 RepID=UPI003414439A
MLRVPVSIATLLTLYYVEPLDHSSMRTAVATLLTGLVGFIVLVTLQVRFILRFRYPALRAVAALAISIPFFLLLFAAAYVAMAAQSLGSFGRHLSHTSGLCFAVTVFTTVGFGDIAAKSRTAQLAVTVQMLMDFIVFGLVIKTIVHAAHRSRESMRTMAADPFGGDLR